MDTQVEAGTGTGDIDAQLVAELTSGAHLGKPAEQTADEGTAEQTETTEAAAATEATEEQVEASVEEQEAEVEETEDEDDLDDVDEETDKRLAPVRKFEKRVRAQLEAERAKLEQERAQHAEDVKAVREFQDLRKRARYDLVSAIKALGVTEDMFEEASLQLYAATEKGRQDPRAKATAERSARERALQDRLDAMERREQERVEQERRAQQQAEEQKQVKAYTDSIAKAATPKLAPLATNALQAMPDEARADMLRIAGQLYAKTGETPKPSAVIKAYEAYLGKLAKIVGGKQAPPAPAAPTQAKQTTSTAAPQKPANDNGPISNDELAAELERELGKLH